MVLKFFPDNKRSIYPFCVLFSDHNGTKYVFLEYFHLHPQHILQQATKTERNKESASAKNSQINTSKLITNSLRHLIENSGRNFPLLPTGILLQCRVRSCYIIEKFSRIFPGKEPSILCLYFLRRRMHFP